MKLALFGATGTTGTAVLDQALDAGHAVRVLARTPAKITRTEERLTVLAGNAMDVAAVRATVAGCDAVISALGGFGDSDSIRIGTAAIASAMQETGLRRLVVVQGFHLDFPGDPRNVGRKAILPLLWLGSRSLISDSRAMAQMLRTSDLDWTLIRAPRITRGEGTGRARVGRLRLSPFNRVANGDIADLALSVLTDTDTFGTAPMIAHDGTHPFGTLGYWALGRRPNRDDRPAART